MHRVAKEEMLSLFSMLASRVLEHKASMYISMAAAQTGVHLRRFCSVSGDETLHYPKTRGLYARKGHAQKSKNLLPLVNNNRHRLCHLPKWLG